MTPSEPVRAPQIPISDFSQATEYELRNAIAQEDRDFIRGSGVDIARMSEDFDAVRFARYCALCRALRAKVRPSGKSQGSAQD